jgi:hypothetical protein
MTDSQPLIGDGEWNDTEAPAEGQLVSVRARDQGGFYVIPFPVQFRNDGWFNPKTGEELDCYIAGWKPVDNAADAT